MLGIRDCFLIQYPTKRWGYVGSVPTVLGAEAPADTAAVLGCRAYRNEAGELVTLKFPAFETAQEAREFAAARGVTVRD